MMKRINIILLFLLSFAIIGCGDSDAPSKKQETMRAFATAYTKICTSVEKDAERIKNGYDAVKRHEKLLVDFHSELKEIESDLRSQKMDAEKIITPNGIDSMQSMGFLKTGIDNYSQAINAFNSIPSDLDPRLILVFEDQIRKGDQQVNFSRQYVNKNIW